MERAGRRLLHGDGGERPGGCGRRRSERECGERGCAARPRSHPGSYPAAIRADASALLSPLPRLRLLFGGCSQATVEALRSVSRVSCGPGSLMRERSSPAWQEWSLLFRETTSPAVAWACRAARRLLPIVTAGAVGAAASAMAATATGSERRFARMAERVRSG